MNRWLTTNGFLKRHLGLAEHRHRVLAEAAAFKGRVDDFSPRPGWPVDDPSSVQ
jgi:hypothetical protein